MRRFENDKRFWEITLEGRTVMTRSGTLGRKGRESRKGYTSSRAALAEIDKRIGKRLEEGGWFEVLPPFEGEVDLEPRIAGIDPEKVAAWERRPGTLQVDGASAAAEVAKSLALGLDRYRAGLDQSVGAAVVSRILEEGPEAVGDNELERAVLMAMAPQAATADLLVARVGLVPVVETLAVGLRLRVDRDLRRAWLVAGESKVPKVRPLVIRLRDLLRCADASTHVACEALVAGAASDALAHQLELVSLFPGAPWVDDWLLRHSAQAPALQALGNASPDAFCDVARGLAGTVHNRPKRLLPQLEQLLVRHGPDAAKAVFLLADGMGVEGLPLMARVQTKEGVRRLLGLLDDKVKGSAARAALVSMSDRTLAVLASIAKHKKAELAFAEELARQPGLAAKLVPHLAPAAARRVQAWAGDVADLDVADDVPAVLSTSDTPLEPWLRLPDLPPLRTPDGERAYPASATAHFVSRLMDQLEGVDEAFAAAVRAACAPESLDGVVAGVLVAWKERAADDLYGTSPWTLVTEDRDEEHDDVPPRARWVRDRNAPEEMEVPWLLHAVDAFGGDTTSEALFRCILAWGSKGGRYGELLSQAVDAMCRLPGEGSLVRLGALARRVQKTRVRIEQHLAKVAREAGLSREGLDEMLLPTLGLDETGSIRLDYGTRTFTGTFDAGLNPVLRDADGSLRKSLPRANAKDDAAAAKRARATWKELRSQVRAMRTTLLGRLELGMRTQRTWRGDAFLRYLATHPVARHPVSGLVWSVENDGERVMFRVDESGAPVDVDDEPVSLDGPVRLVHPVQLTEEERRSWRDVFVDYELLQPFDQLERVTFHHGDALSGVQGKAIPRGRLFALRSKGWVFHTSRVVEEMPYDQPMLYALSLTIGGFRVVVKAHGPVDLKQDEEMLVGTIERFSGEWDDLPPAWVSEVGRDLQRAVAEA